MGLWVQSLKAAHLPTLEIWVEQKGNQQVKKEREMRLVTQTRISLRSDLICSTRNHSHGPSGLDGFFVTNSSINQFLRYPLWSNESVNHILTFGRSVPKNSLRFNTSLVSLRSSKMVTQPPLVFFIFLVTKWKFTTSLLRNNWCSCC